MFRLPKLPLLRKLRKKPRCVLGSGLVFRTNNSRELGLILKLTMGRPKRTLRQQPRRKRLRQQPKKLLPIKLPRKQKKQTTLRPNPFTSGGQPAAKLKKSTEFMIPFLISSVAAAFTRSAMAALASNYLMVGGRSNLV
jgi:hypothetical protein